MGSGKDHTQFPANGPESGMTRTYKKENPQFTAFPIRYNWGRAYILTYFLPMDLPVTFDQAPTVQIGETNFLGEWKDAACHLP